MPVTERPRYDGHADWYDEHARGQVGSGAEMFVSMLGPGSGRCLDLACGTGAYFDAIRSTGRVVVGVDISADQLRVAARRGSALVRADASGLPFADASFDVVAAFWMSTDVDEFTGVVHEAARVLVPGGTFFVHGVHPCFNGPCVEMREDGAVVVHPTYRDAGRHESSPWWSPGGIRQRIGMVHLPLADLINAIVDAGLTVTRVAESGGQPVPNALTLRAAK
jgi:ubiquinone/menaquinone biosynthesis C-methylase UbiE